MSISLNRGTVTTNCTSMSVFGLLQQAGQYMKRSQKKVHFPSNFNISQSLLKSGGLWECLEVNWDLPHARDFNGGTADQQIVGLEKGWKAIFRF